MSTTEGGLSSVRFSLAALVLLLGSAIAPTASAQDETTFQSSTGATWAVAVLEVGLVVGAILFAGDDAPDGVGALVYLAGVLVAAGVTAGVAQATDLAVEPALMVHQGIQGAALLGGLGLFSGRAAGLGEGELAWLGIGGLVLGAAGALTYTGLRLERLSHDPALTPVTHVLSWAPLVAAGLTTMIGNAISPEPWVTLLGPIVGILTYAVTVIVAEAVMADTPYPAEVAAPLTSAIRF